ncbi:5875_t:CDS:2, partial [Scutellospora calospora]
PNDTEISDVIDINAFISKLIESEFKRELNKFIDSKDGCSSNLIFLSLVDQKINRVFLERYNFSNEFIMFIDKCKTIAFDKDNRTKFTNNILNDIQSIRSKLDDNENNKKTLIKHLDNLSEICDLVQ